MQRLKDWLTRHGELVVRLLLSVYFTIYTVRQIRSGLGEHGQAIADLALDQSISDFESFYRCGLRMAQGLPMYFPDGAGRLEEPSKQAPFFELLLQPFLPFGFGVTAAAFGIISLLALLATLRLGKRLLRAAPGGESAGFGSVFLALALLFAPLHLNQLYFQTGVMLVALFVLGIALLERRPLLAGVVWSAAISIKVIPIVVLPWMLWRRQWRCVTGIVLGLVAANAAVLAYTGWTDGVAQYRGYATMLREDPVFREYNERYQSISPLIRATVTPHYESEIKSTAQSQSWDGRRNFLGNTGLAAHADLLVNGAIALLLLVCALACRPRGPTTSHRWLLEGSLVAIAMLLISPHTWQHYFWWLFPAALAAMAGVRRRQSWAAVAITTLVIAEVVMRRGFVGGLATRWEVFHGPAIAALVLFGALAAHLFVTDRRVPAPA